MDSSNSEVRRLLCARNGSCDIRTSLQAQVILVPSEALDSATSKH